MSDHGLIPVRPRTSPLEATILEELRELREQNRDLVARVEALERKNGTDCSACEHEHEKGRICLYLGPWNVICGCTS